MPFKALADVFGRDAMYWNRAWMAFGRPNLGDMMVKVAGRMPGHLVADEKISWLDKAGLCVPATVGDGCLLGIRLAGGAAEMVEKLCAQCEAFLPAYDCPGRRAPRTR